MLKKKEDFMQMKKMLHNVVTSDSDNILMIC